MTQSWRRIAIGIGVALALAGCTRVYNQGAPTGPTVTTPPAETADKIEFRVFGNVGAAPVLIKFTNTVDGLSVLSSASLPYVATIQSEESSIFLYLEASALSGLLSGGTLQVQIYVNGRLFREGFASGIATLTATAAGTYRR